MLVWQLTNWPWLLMLVVQHTYQIMANLTTNELWNWKRYAWLRHPVTGAYQNKYSRGIIGNVTEFINGRFRMETPGDNTFFSEEEKMV